MIARTFVPEMKEFMDLGPMYFVYVSLFFLPSQQVIFSLISLVVWLLKKQTKSLRSQLVLLFMLIYMVFVVFSYWETYFYQRETFFFIAIISLYLTITSLPILLTKRTGEV